MIRRSTRAAGLGVALALAASGMAVISSASAPAPAPAQTRPPLYVMADSVVLGADGALRTAFPDYQVNMAGFPAIFTRVAADVIRREAGRVGDVAVVAVGHNYPFWDPDRFDRAIDSVVRNLVAAGAKHVVWITLRHATHANSPPSSWWQVDRYAWYFPTVNRHLRRALDRHPELSLADWAAISSGTGLTYDSIHLNTAGQSAMADLVRRSVDLALRRAPAGTVLRVPATASASVPTTTRGVVVQATLSNPRRGAHVDVYACGRAPATGTRVAVPASQVATHHVFVRLTATGAVCLRLDDAMEATAQVLSHAPRGSPAGNVSTSLAAGVTVGPGEILTMPLPDAGARRRGAAVVEVAAAGINGSAVYSVYPCDQRPLWTNPLRATGAGRTSHAVVRPSADGALCLRARRPMVVSVDLVGSVANQAQLRARRPVRLARVRPDEPLPAGRRLSVDALDHPALPDDVDALSIYIRVKAALVPGELEIGTCRRPTTAISGWRFAAAGVTTVAHVKPGNNGKICLRSSQPVAFDAWVVGWADKKPVLADTSGRPRVASTP